jgi:hypothetical protein
MEQTENVSISNAEVTPAVETRKEKREYSTPTVEEFTPAVWAASVSF